MEPWAIKAAMESAVLCLDTRERDTPALRKRIKQIGLPVERAKLNCGDYSIKCNCLDLSERVAVERKMSIDELAMCYTTERERFEREFVRAKEHGTRLYLLVEDATWSKIYGGKYRSRMKAKALVASITAWLARYDCQILTVEESVSGDLIRDVLLRELREALEAKEDVGEIQKQEWQSL